MTDATPACLWNDSTSLREADYALDHGAVGATCNSLLVAEGLKKEMHRWKDRIHGLIETLPQGRETEEKGRR
jgi:transaldolase